MQVPIPNEHLQSGRQCQLLLEVGAHRSQPLQLSWAGNHQEGSNTKWTVWTMVVGGIHRKEKIYSDVSICSAWWSPIASMPILIADAGLQTAHTLLMLCFRWRFQVNIPFISQGRQSDILVWLARWYMKHTFQLYKEVHCISRSGEKNKKKESGAKWKFGSQIPYRVMFQAQNIKSCSRSSNGCSPER